MFLPIIILAAVGLIISLYAYILEQKVKQNPNYKATCDISERMSCTLPIRSPYARIFYFSNAVIGMIYYVIIAVLAWLELPFHLFIVSIGGVLGSLALAYILYFKIRTFCLVCTSLYIINFLLLFLSYRLYSQ